MHCFGSFLLQSMFLSLQVFAFKGQNMKLTVNMLFTCILLFTCIAGAFTMACVWFLNLETVNDVEGNKKSKIPDWNQKWPAICVSHLGGFFDFQDIRWPLAFPGHVHRYILHGINDKTVLLIWHEYKHFFDSQICQIVKVCLGVLLTFFSLRASCEGVRYGN